MRARAIVVAALAAATVLVGGVPAQAATRRRTPTTGASSAGPSSGRPIVARHVGSLDAPVQLVVIGQMHGSEPGGRKVVELASRRRIPDGVGLWLITSMNPDGATRGHPGQRPRRRPQPQLPRRLARGRRAAPYLVRVRGPASEPETRAMVRFLSDRAADGRARRSTRPSTSSTSATAAAGRRAGSWPAAWGSGPRSCGCTGRCHGTMTQWVDAELGAIALTVELDRRVSGAEADRAAAAVLRLGQWLGR